MQTLSSSEAFGPSSACASCTPPPPELPDPQAGKPSCAPRGETAGALRFRILAADDIALNRAVLRRACQYLHYECDVVESGAELRHMLHTGTYDMVLVDLHMPHMDGLSVALEICRIFPDPLQRPRIVALTGDTRMASCEGCRLAGMDDCLIKPIMPDRLQACVDVLCRGTGRPAADRARPSPEATRSTGTLLVDRKSLARLNLDEDSGLPLNFIAELHTASKADFLTRRPLVATACQTRDPRALEEILHGYMGCFLTLGWTAIYGECRAARARLRLGQFADWETFPASLLRLFEASSAEMDRVLSEGAEPGTPPP